jgi:hypothetical protein
MWQDGRGYRPKGPGLYPEPTPPTKYYHMTYVERAHATLAR